MGLTGDAYDTAVPESAFFATLEHKVKNGAESARERFNGSTRDTNSSKDSCSWSDFSVFRPGRAGAAGDRKHTGKRGTPRRDHRYRHTAGTEL